MVRRYRLCRAGARIGNYLCVTANVSVACTTAGVVGNRTEQGGQLSRDQAVPDSVATSSKASRSGRRAGAGKARVAGEAAASETFQVVGIGASAGGLEACTGLLDALPQRPGMAFILVQHLDPTHESLLVELLAKHTGMTVLQAADGARPERDHLYIIPPGAVLTMGNGLLRLEPVPAGRGARLPFDALLLSMAGAYGPNASCIVLSGNGADGSAGLLAIKRQGGFVLAQEPGEAEYDGMPRSAAATGMVDAVLPVAAMPGALAERRLQPSVPDQPAQPRQPDERFDPAPPDGKRDHLAGIIQLLRVQAGHDFTLYKRGTLKRRVERRMAMAGVEGMDRYAETLKRDPDELGRLAKDLLIHVTSFFRDPAVFDQLVQTAVPELIRDHAGDQPIRTWVAGCSTGEEAYSLAMVFHERLAASGRSLRLQIFASDADADAVASAREGLYPHTIETDVGPQRLAAFFTREEEGYRVLPELRAMVVVHRPGPAGGPAVLAARLRVVQERHDLPGRGSAAEGDRAVPLRLAARRPPAARQC